MHNLAYGVLDDQVGDLYLPRSSAAAAVVCLVHGGFWRMPWARDHIAPLAGSLVKQGFAVWNLEYRRVGQAGGGWPGTLQDVSAGIAHLAALAADTSVLDLQRVIVVGHSAGGQLALWAASHSRSVRIAAVCGLAPVADMHLAYELRCGNGAVRDFLGGSPLEHPERYRTSSPAALLPLQARQLILHGTDDEDVPVEISRQYVAAAQAAGGIIEWRELGGVGHMELIDIRGEAHDRLCAWLTAVADDPAHPPTA